jgi:hypothetical protein
MYCCSPSLHPLTLTHSPPSSHLFLFLFLFLFLTGDNEFAPILKQYLAMTEFLKAEMVASEVELEKLSSQGITSWIDEEWSASFFEVGGWSSVLVFLLLLALVPPAFVPSALVPPALVPVAPQLLL